MMHDTKYLYVHQLKVNEVGNSLAALSIDFVPFHYQQFVWNG